LTRHRLVLVVALAAALRVTPAVAQGTGDGAPDPAKVRVRIGPLLMNPTVSLTNIGIDRNVFNEAENPKRDFTFTVVPQTDVWLRMGRTWITATIKEDLIWYQKYTTERSANNTDTIGWLVPLNRLKIKTSANHASTKERPGYEIDTRSQHTETTYSASVEVRALSKTYFGVVGLRQKFEFASDAVFLGSNLQTELSRVSTSAGLIVRQQVTPLTSISVIAQRQQDRFEFSPLRDADSTALTATVEFDPFALIKGSATFGYRDFQPRAAGLPSYQGTTAAVNLTYTLLGSTRFTGTIARDVQYSYDVRQPYYLQTGFTGSISQQLFGPFDVVGRGGAQTLAYRDRVGAVVQVSNQVDYSRTYGGGLGYHLGKDLRLGFNVDETKRISDVSLRQYNDLTMGTSVTYVY
jgi:hypothetical protein